MAEGKGATPEKYEYKDHQKDDDTVARVEAAIRKSPMGKFQKWLDGPDPVNPPEVHGKVDDTKKDMDKAAKDHPDEAKQAGPAPSVTQGAPTKPDVKAPAAHGGADATRKGGKGPDAKDKKIEAKGGAAASHGGGGGGHGGSMAAKTAGMNDAELSDFLNKDPSVKHSPEPKEKLGKISEMAKIAKGLDGKLDSFVSDGSVGGWLAAAGKNILGKKDLNAVWTDNPYRKVDDGLHRIMTGISALKHVFGMVGNVAGKIGLVLTVVGLLGMIFPPIGLAVSGIARVLNIVGLICDALAFATSGVLTGLNGVALARQIAKGGSSEEKAATADLMVTEANDTSAAFISLAMNFGGKFMKGLLNNSKGFVSTLLRRFKAFVGKIAGRLTGNVKNVAKKMLYKLGLGLGKAGPPGLGSKIWNAPGALLDKAKNASFVKNFNEGKWGQGLEKFGARAGALADKMDEKIIGNATGRLGDKLSGVGANSGLADRLAKAAEADEATALREAEKRFSEDAANKERATIQQEIAEKRASAQDKRDLRPEAASKAESKELKRDAAKLDKEAGKLERGMERKVGEAEKEGAKEFSAEHAREVAEESKKKAIADGAKAYKSDPKAFEADGEKLATEKAALEGKLATADAAEKKAIEKEIAETQEKIDFKKEVRARVATGGAEEDPVKNLSDAKGAYGELKDNVAKLFGRGGPAEEEFSFSKPLAYNKEVVAKKLEKDDGHADRESAEGDERHEEMTRLHAATLSAPTVSTASHVDEMLGGVGGAPEPEAAPGPESHAPSADGASPAISSGGPSPAGGEGGGPAPAPATVSEAPTPKDKASGGAGGEGGAEEIPYWPALIEPGGGEFGKALDDLRQMRRVATEFRKAQFDAKKKAQDVLETYGKYEDYAKAKQKLAAEHKAETAQTKGEAVASGDHAKESENQAGKGNEKQEEGKNAGKEKVDTELRPPEPHGFWARILARVKRWACEKAAKAFAIVQERIANLILEGLCGVSMDDIKQYGGALRNRMSHSKDIAGQADEKTDEASNKSVKLQGDVNAAVKEAVDGCNECDRNIEDADKFMVDLDATESDLVAEQAKAISFLQQVRAEHDAQKAEKQRQDEEKASKEQGAPQGVGGGSQDTGGASPPGGAPPTKAPDQKPQVSAADAAKVHAAAGYLSTQAGVAYQHVDSERTRQLGLLKMQTQGHSIMAGAYASAWNDLGGKVMKSFKRQTDGIQSDSSAISSADIATVEALHSAVQRLKGMAQNLDAKTSESVESLNGLFKAAYGLINKTGNSMTGRAMKGINRAGSGVEGQADKALDAVGA